MPTHRAVSIDELSQYLHLPEKAVAKELGICLTSLKKLCRQNGITRWPYRKLKSLDKKIARAENGTDALEDAETLQARAEELKKEKMAVAFTYGLKPRGYIAKKSKGQREAPSSPSDSGTPPAVDMLSVDEVLVPEVAKAVSKPKKHESEGEISVPAVSAPASVLVKSAPHVWSDSANRDSPTSIPTPPDTETFDTVGEGVDADLLSEAAENVMASNALLEDTRMNSSISWEAPSLDDAPVEAVGDCPVDTGADCDTPSSLGSIPEFSDAVKEGGKSRCDESSTPLKTKAGNSAGSRSMKSGKGKNVKGQKACHAPLGDLNEGDVLAGRPRLEKASELFARCGSSVSGNSCAHASACDSPAASQRPGFGMGEHEHVGETYFSQDMMDSSDFFSEFHQGGSMRGSHQSSMPATVPTDGEADASGLIHSPLQKSRGGGDECGAGEVSRELSLTTVRLEQEDGVANLPPVALMGESSWDLWPGAAQTPGSCKDAHTPASKEGRAFNFPSPPASPGKALPATRSSSSSRAAAAAAAAASASAASTARKVPPKDAAAVAEQAAPSPRRSSAAAPSSSTRSSSAHATSRCGSQGRTASVEDGAPACALSTLPLAEKSPKSGKRRANGGGGEPSAGGRKAEVRVTRSRGRS